MSGRPPVNAATTFTRFGDYLKFLRRRAQLSQREVAIAVGYSEMQISRLERDLQRPDPHTLMALFVPALDLEDEPELVARLLELAAAGRAESAARVLPRDAGQQSPATAHDPANADPPGSAEQQAMSSGTAVLLGGDIDHAPQLWEQYPRAMPEVIARFSALVREIVVAHGGSVVKTDGERLVVAFATPTTALSAGLAIEQRMAAEAWSMVEGPRARLALHAGTVDVHDGNYGGPTLNRLSRLLDAGHGGQVLLTRVMHDLVRDDLPPGVSLRDLGTYQLRDLRRQDQIFQLIAPGLSVEFPPLQGVERRRQQLPAPSTSFIGREHELAMVVELLRQDDLRMLTLTGPGGTGKTRLSLQVAAELLDHFPDGVWFVDLAPIRDPALVVSSIATTLEVREAGNQTLIAGLQAYLQDKRMLLILDNFEQVLAAALQLADLLQAAPNLKLLVTSRSILGVYGEHAFAMPPLALPDLARLPPLEQLVQYEAIRLFIQRAQAAKADFKVTNESAPAIAEICHRLDGLPLPIELAAARIRMLPPEALLRRLASRLQVLTGGARTLPARQQTLRDAIAWSYDLLDPWEQMLFRRVAIFVGGWTMETAEAVCNAASSIEMDVLDGLQSLLDKSLIRLTIAWNDEPRFTMLETIREYALEQLAGSGEVEATLRQHIGVFVALAEQSEPALTGPDQQHWLTRIDLEHDNLRTALASALSRQDIETSLRLATALEWFWYLHGDWSEGRVWLERVLRQADSRDHMLLRSRAQFAAAELAYYQNDYPEAVALYQESLLVFREVGDDLHAGLTLHGLGNVALHQRDYEQARLLLEESLILMQSHGDNRRIGNVFHKLGDVLLMQGDIDGAARLFDEGLACYRVSGDKGAIAASLTYAGGVARQRGDLPHARALCEEGLQLCRELNHKLGLAWVLRYLGSISMDEGDPQRAVGYFEESLHLRWELRDREGFAWSLEGLAETVAALGQLVRAAWLWGQAEALREAVGAAISAAEHQNYDKLVAAARASCDAEQFAAAWNEGRRMPFEQAVNLALYGAL